MTTKTEIKVNNKRVPLNPFVNKLTAKLILAIAESLKGLEEDIKEIQVNVKY